jgi:hypothetical protein
MTTTLNTSCLENTMVCQQDEGFCMHEYSTGGKFVIADQKIAGRNKALLHLHSKESRN